MENEKIKSKLQQAEDLVKHIKDDALRVKAFELAYKELSGNLVSELVKEPKKEELSNSPQNKKAESIVEYSKRFQIKNEIDRVLIFGSYVEKQQDKTFFITKDITDCYFKAKEKQPPNIPDKISKNIAKGFIMESQEKPKSGKGYVLTRTGEEQIKKLEIKNEN